jgi:uridine kinase
MIKVMSQIDTSSTKNFIIGIAGPSCSGKSELSNALASYFNGINIETDVFYKTRPPQRYCGFPNWEHKDCLMWDNLADCLDELKNNRSFLIPTFECSERFDRLLLPSRVIIPNGFLLFLDSRVTSLCDEKIFVDVSEENQLLRRVNSDGERVYNFCRQVVIPHYKIYREQIIGNSDFIVDGNKPKADVFQIVLNYLLKKYT